MKNRIMCLSLVMVLLFSLTIHANELSITESPNVKIVIDGAIGDYDDVPLIVNNRTMLPLRAVLVNLGVQNDDEHIIWNNDERSVTVVTDEKTIWLQVDSYTAKIDGQEVSLDVAPMIYAENNRTYIPARFISEALGKMVAWDGSTTAVLITDIERYNAIKEVLTKSGQAMEAAENISLDLISSTATSGQEDFSMEIILSLIENPQHAQSYMKLGLDLGLDIEAMMEAEVEPDEEMQGLLMMMAFLNMEVYEMEDFTYSKSFLSGDGWLKSETETDEGSSSSSISVSQDTMMLGTDDTVIAGLIMTDNVAESTIVLEGTVYIEDMADQLMSLGSGNLEEAVIEEYHVVYTVDRDTYEVISLEVVMVFVGDDNEGVMSKVTSTTRVDMAVLEESYLISVPEEVLNNIVEIDFGF